MTQALSNTMGELSDVRKNIDQLDDQLLALLAQRRALAERVIRIKHADNTPLRDEQREGEILRARIVEGRALGLDAQLITKIFHEVLADSNRLQ